MTEPLKANQYVATLKLNSDITSLDDLGTLQTEYKKLINVRKAMVEQVKVDDPESYLIYSWEDNNSERLKVGGLRYTIWNAKIEHQKMNMYDATDTHILPKDQRTGKYFVPTIFYESNGAVYLCVVTKKDSVLHAVEELIDSRHIDIASNHLATNENMVEWLFWRYMSKRAVLRMKMKQLQSIIYGALMGMLLMGMFLIR